VHRQGNQRSVADRLPMDEPIVRQFVRGELDGPLDDGR
jgi:hypothetical protein